MNRSNLTKVAKTIVSRPAAGAVEEDEPLSFAASQRIVAHLICGGTLAGTAALFGLPLWDVVSGAIDLARDERLALDFDQLHELGVIEAMRHPADLAAFGRSLGLSIESLLIGEVGRFPPWDAWTSPIRNAQGRVVGERVRLQLRRKTSIFTSDCTGVFCTWPIDTGVAPGPVIAPEGDSDWLTGIGLGLCVVGRPNATAGDDTLLDVLRGIDRDLVVIADRDEKGVGEQSAERVAARIEVDLGREARVLMVPDPFKDLRSWVTQGGATRDDVLRLVTAPRRARTRVRLIGGLG